MSKSYVPATVRTPSSVQKTPKRRKCTDPVEVYCRIRPLLGALVKCVEQISETTLKITAPVTSQTFKNNPVSLFYTFNGIFEDKVHQKPVFDKVALPLVGELIRGKNGLLFAYGVTSSGKTHTMIGQANNPGILPRCLDVVFNTIGENQARPFIFLPDDNNGMKIQPEYQAVVMKNQKERQKRQEERLRRKEERPETPDPSKADEIRIPDSTKLDCVNEDSAYAVFISYVEVYNNYIFDLLEDDQVNEFGHPTLPISKKVGDDTKNRVMYVKDVAEIEVKSTEEACLQVWKGQERRRKANTILNDKSSRSHSVFNIRLVQAPYDEEGKQILLNKDMLTISQLSLVDLAGSERASKTHATGEMLKEAGNINNSLMTLHACLETLRSNQLAGRPAKMVPYRESKLTLLFKNFFEGSGRVKMVVCVNPRSEDFDETLNVMKFAELTQDVQVQRGQEVQFDENHLQPGRRKQNLLYKRVSGQGGEPLSDVTNTRNSFGFNLPSVPPAFNMPPFPSWTAQDASSEDKGQAILAALHERQKLRNDAQADFEKRKQRMRAVLVKMEKEQEENTQKTSQFNEELVFLKGENEQMRTDNVRLENQNLKLKRENDKLKKQNSLYQFERRQVIDEKKKTDEKIKKEVEKRENIKKTFKQVVGREKEKWEKNTEQMIRRVDLRAAQQESKLRQVLEIVGGNPEALPDFPKIDVPRLDDIMFPSSAASTAPSEEEAASHDHYNYTIPFSRTKRYLDTVGGDVDPNNISPAVSSALGAISLGATTGLGVSPRTGLLGPAAPSSMYGSEAPSSVGSSSKPPSQQTSTVAASTRSHPTKENKPHAPPPLGGIKVLPTGPVPSSLFKTPKTPAASHVSSASKHTGRPDTKAKVPTPAPSIKPHATISPVLSKARRQNPKAKLNPPSKPSEQPINPSLECHISVDDRPDIPLKARIPKNVDGSKWLNHRPIENFDEANVLKPNLDNKKTVAIPDLDDFDDQTNRYLLQHQEQDSLGEIRTQFIKGDIKISRGGGRCIEFTDIETSSKVPSAKEVFSSCPGTYPPAPQNDSGDWTDTETRCAVGVGIPTAKTKPNPTSR